MSRFVDLSSLGALAALAFGAVSASACGGVSAPPRAVVCGSQPVQVLPNPSFDLSSPPWVQDPVTPPLLCGAPTIVPADGMLAACLGGMDGQTETLSQTVPLPDGAKTATLSGQICITTAETAAADNDTLTFTLNDGANTIAQLGKFSNQQGVKQDCVFMSFTMPAATLASDPETATLTIQSKLNTQDTTSFFVDALSLTISCN